MIKYEFRFNTSYGVAEVEGSLKIMKWFRGNEIGYFDPITFEYEGDEVRYIPQSAREEIKDELLARKPELYAEIYGEPNPTPTANVQDLSQLLVDLNRQNMEMFKQLRNPYEESIIEGIISKASDISTETLVEKAFEKMDEYIHETYGALPKRIEIQKGSDVKTIEGLLHNKFETILQLVNLNIPTMLVGPAGSGKNHTLEQVAEALNLEFYFSNAITQEYKLTGFVDANGNYHETQFYKAFKNGGLFFLDEIDASIPEVLIILNSAIANRYFDFPNEKVYAHKDFRVVSAGNTMGTGANAEYTGRNKLDAATLDRFAVIEFDYDPEVESQLASTTELYDFIVGLRNTIKELEIRYVVSMRSTINASKLDGVLDKGVIIDSVILKGLPQDDKDMICGNLDLVNNAWYDKLKEGVK